VKKNKDSEYCNRIFRKSAGLAREGSEEGEFREELLDFDEIEGTASGLASVDTV
jgi:hypothetical protein